MQLSKFSLGLAVGVLIFPLFSNAVVHGGDDRKNFFEEPSALLKSYAGSVAISFHSHLRAADGTIVGQFMGGAPFGISSPVRNEWNLCSGERFAEEFTIGAGGCTGFLVAPDLLMTASHCFRDGWEANADPAVLKATVEQKCQAGKMLWMFDAYAESPADLQYEKNGDDRVFAGRSPKHFFDDVSVYGCKEVLYISPPHSSREAPGPDFEDYAIVRLKTATQGRRIFPIARQDPTAQMKLGMVGFPQSLMAKFTSQGRATNLSTKNHFLSNLDAFVGNSGSPVIDLATGEVVGMEVGSTELKFGEELREDETNFCNHLSTLSEADGRAVVLKPSVFLGRLRPYLR